MERNLEHIRILRPTDTIGFTIPQSPIHSKRTPHRNRTTHGQLIRQKLEQAWRESEEEIAVYHSTRGGAYIEFQSLPGFDIRIMSLEDLGKDIRICNVRQQENPMQDGTKGITFFITVFVPNDQRQAFFRKIDAYLTDETDSGDPKNKALIDGIDDLRNAVLVGSFWTDAKNLIPKDGQKEWCEVWLRDDRDDNDVEGQFDNVLEQLEIKKKPESIKFPERLVNLVLASRQNLAELTKYSGDIAEYRKAKSTDLAEYKKKESTGVDEIWGAETTANFLLSKSPADQSKFVDGLVQRLSVDTRTDIAVCLLDTGVNNGHPLIEPLLSSADCQTVNPVWQTHDHDKHGTLMAGLIGYGDLQHHLESGHSVIVKHRLESVKILPPGYEKNPVELWGDITKQGISKAEIQAENRKRIICMPVSAEDTRDRGRPSSWSAAIDQVTSGADDGERRLMIVAAGNSDQGNWESYPDSNLTDSVHDPAQSWNALTVGATTNLQQITEPTLSNYNPVAMSGQLSPFTTTSNAWENNKWPVKPDVVFEGGNLAVDSVGFLTECDDFSLVSTFYKHNEESLFLFNMTSAATAQAANFAACIQSEYPDYWPETIRALIVHSANWQDATKAQLARNNSKTELNNVLRSCGYGNPDIERALYCARNSLTLISEASIQPFEKDGSVHKTKDMHLYELPWPKEILEELGSADVEMRITLSYFIEPGPGEIGWKDRYRYASHGLRFDLNSPAEDKSTFLKRINAKSRGKHEGKPDSKSPTDHWVIGSDNRNKGSIHSDIWKGTATELASSNLIAISPRIGWWRERHHLGKYDQTTRYSLVVSISTPENDVDIYNPVKVSLSQPIATPVRDEEWDLFE